MCVPDLPDQMEEALNYGKTFKKGEVRMLLTVAYSIKVGLPVGY